MASVSPASSSSSSSYSSSSSSSSSYYSEADVDKMIENKAKYVSRTSSDLGVDVAIQTDAVTAQGPAPKIAVNTLSTTVDWYFNPDRPAKNQEISTDTDFQACIFEVLAYIEDNECGEVNEEYIQRFMPNASAIVVLRNNGDNGNIIGFACVIFVSNGAARKPHILYVDILCGNSKYSGIGTKLIDSIKQYGAQHFIWKIKLSSIEPALGFYIRLGFNCNPCKMELSIPRPGRGRRTIRKQTPRKKPKATIKSK